VSLPASDNFNRADAPTLGANWTELEAATHDIHTNEARGVASCYAYWNADVFSGDHYSQVGEVTVVGTSANVATNMSGSAGNENLYQWGGGGSGELYKWVAGSFTLLQSAGTFSAGSKLKLSHQGTTLKCYINDVQQGGDVSDSALTGGAPGLATSSSQYDNWVGDNVASDRRFLLVRH
jgi:hypothetical protein